MHQCQSTKYEDAQCLLQRVLLINDVVTFNCTMNLGKKYQNWVDEHHELINELVNMLISDIKLIEEDQVNEKS
jgi:hypothetical protein